MHAEEVAEEGNETAQDKRQRLAPGTAAPSSLPTPPPEEQDVLCTPPPPFFLMANRGLPGRFNRCPAAAFCMHACYKTMGLCPETVLDG